VATYLHLTSVSAGAAAENAAEKNEAKYAGLAASYTFLPLALESLGPINEDGLSFLSDLGCHICHLGMHIRQIRNSKAAPTFLFAMIDLHCIRYMNQIADS